MNRRETSSRKLNTSTNRRKTSRHRSSSKDLHSTSLDRSRGLTKNKSGNVSITKLSLMSNNRNLVREVQKWKCEAGRSRDSYLHMLKKYGETLTENNRLKNEIKALENKLQQQIEVYFEEKQNRLRSALDKSSTTMLASVRALSEVAAICNEAIPVDSIFGTNFGTNGLRNSVIERSTGRLVREEADEENLLSHDGLKDLAVICGPHMENENANIAGSNEENLKTAFDLSVIIEDANPIDSFIADTSRVSAQLQQDISGISAQLQQDTSVITAQLEQDTPRSRNEPGLAQLQPNATVLEVISMEETTMIDTCIQSNFGDKEVSQPDIAEKEAAKESTKIEKLVLAQNNCNDEETNVSHQTAMTNEENEEPSHNNFVAPELVSPMLIATESVKDSEIYNTQIPETMAVNEQINITNEDELQHDEPQMTPVLTDLHPTITKRKSGSDNRKRGRKKKKLGKTSKSKQENAAIDQENAAQNLLIIQLNDQVTVKKNLKAKESQKEKKPLKDANRTEVSPTARTLELVGECLQDYIEDKNPSSKKKRSRTPKGSSLNSSVDVPSRTSCRARKAITYTEPSLGKKMRRAN